VPGEGVEPLPVDVLIRVPQGDRRLAVLGPADRNLKMIREVLGIKITSREGAVKLSGPRPSVVAARDVLHRLQQTAEAAHDEHAEPPGRQQVLDLINWATSRQLREGSGFDHGGEDAPADLPEHGPAWGQTLDVYVAGRPVQAKTPNQQAYLDAIRDNDLVFGIGPAGTGKTYLAVAAAVHLLKADRIRKVFLVRPAVEAGEKLGFLPGDLQAKVNPYLRPLFDALHDMMDFNTIKRFVMSDVVEVAPLAYMRGRTLNRAVIILDEAQNTTRTQMKMFLTRMGQGSKMIVTGDITQIDLPDPGQSGLIDAGRILRRTRGVEWVHFDDRDIVRHDLVQRIVEAYARHETPPHSPAHPHPPRPYAVQESDNAGADVGGEASPIGRSSMEGGADRPQRPA
jgi:phosphate starvation-inducible PhoH-like protein